MTALGVIGGFADHAFLKALGERHLMLLVTGAQPRTFGVGQFLAKEGEIAREFYLIKAGHVDLAIHTPDRGEVVVQTVGPGDALGWSWVVPPHRWRFDCKAKDNVQVIAFNAEWLREKCEQDHELGYHLLKHLTGAIAERLAATRLQLLNLKQ